MQHSAASVFFLTQRRGALYWRTSIAIPTKKIGRSGLLRFFFKRSNPSPFPLLNNQTPAKISIHIQKKKLAQIEKWTPKSQALSAPRHIRPPNAKISIYIFKTKNWRRLKNGRRNHRPCLRRVTYSRQNFSWATGESLLSTLLLTPYRSLRRAYRKKNYKKMRKK